MLVPILLMNILSIPLKNYFYHDQLRGHSKPSRDHKMWIEILGHLNSYLRVQIGEEIEDAQCLKTLLSSLNPITFM